jgi:hypothetical protein
MQFRLRTLLIVLAMAATIGCKKSLPEQAVVPREHVKRELADIQQAIRLEADIMIESPSGRMECAAVEITGDTLSSIKKAIGELEDFQLNQHRFAIGMTPSTILTFFCEEPSQKVVLQLNYNVVIFGEDEMVLSVLPDSVFDLLTELGDKKLGYPSPKRNGASDARHEPPDSSIQDANAPPTLK